MRHVVVVGAGASGIVAAISAAREGARVTLIEQKDRIGKKILSTGNGRCNYTNTYMDVSCFRGDNTEIVSKILEQFNYRETIQFFEELGVLHKERQGYIYPITDQATTILDVLRLELDKLNIRILLEQKVISINKNKRHFVIKTNSDALQCDAVILSTGGKAAPVLGSDGSGYALAKQFGHHISPVVPALVQLRGDSPYFKQLAGIRTQAMVTLYVDQQKIASDTGELQLTNYGISGIPVFQISRFASKAFYKKQSVEAEIDFIPSMTEQEFTVFLQKRLRTLEGRNAEEFLIGLFHKNIIQILLKEAKIKAQSTITDVSELVHVCKHFHIPIIGTNDFEQAQICAGGIKTTEVNPQTLESVYENNLYITGELLDIDGICGGYNLQWAWSTGYLAGKNAAKGTRYASNRTT